MLRYQTIRKFSAESGYTLDAINGKIRDGIWVEGEVWLKAPDGRRLIDIQGYEKWVEKEVVSLLPANRRLKSPSPIAASAAASVSKSPRPLRI